MSSTAAALAPFSDKVRIPTQHDAVFNEECLFSFDSPDTDDGLYICMEKFLGLGKEHVAAYHARTDNAIFVHRKRTKIPKETKKDDGSDEVPEKVSRMAIGVPGGFNPEARKYDYSEENAIVVMPDFKSFPLDDADIPLAIQMSAKAIIKAESAVRKGELEASAGTWDGEKIEVSKYANDLQQLDNGKKIPPKGWKCEKCDLTSNLWLNLTDGAILCGRKFFDGSGGNNHAVDYYKETKYPLAVKLGTITADGKADVFSYAEDAMVSDPHLAQHLAHFGINITSLTKTDKSMAEIEIDMNQRIGEWATLTESGSKLVPVYGPGYTGLENLGNTCYMNSVLQVLFQLPSFAKVYVEGAPAVFKKANLHDPMSDFRLQMCKLGTSLWSGKYSTPPTDLEKQLEGEEFQKGVRPVVFKTLVGKGHPDFSGKEQQDANEFYTHLTTLMDRCHHNPDDMNPADRLMFEVEDRMQCGSSSKVLYKTRVEDYLPLPIDLSDALNKEAFEEYEKTRKELQAKGEKIEEKDKVRAEIPLEACLQRFCLEEQVSDFYSPAIKGKTFAKKTMRMRTFPDYLFVQLKKFAVSDDWTPYKLDVEVAMPDEIDISCLKTPGGLQPGEEAMPEEEPSSGPASASAVVPDPAIVEQLLGMGFDVNGCKKAAFHTNNSGFEAAVNWIMTHMEDADFSAPFVQPGAATPAAASFTPNPEGLAMLESMGMPTKKCVKALRETDNNVERAVDWIFSHPDDDGSDDPAPAASVSGQQAGNSPSTAHKLTDGEPKYELRAFISHMGSSVHVGHYVCHILRDGKWVIYNDNKVALSEKPPKGLGYLYLYKRKDSSE